MKSESDAKPSTRSIHMRSGIIAMVEASPYVPQRSRRVVILGSIALVLAGLVVGGGVSAAAFGSSNDPNLQGDLHNDARYAVGQNYGKLVGQAHYIQTSGRTEVNLGKAPQGATGVSIAFQCFAAGTYTLTVDGHSEDEICGTSASVIPSTRNPDTESFTVKAGGDHVVSMDSHGANGFALWASFLKFAVLPGPSAQEQLELSDGKVTRAEYFQAFNRYEGCMAEAGFPMAVMPFIDGRFSYALPDDATAASDKECYPREFEGVDIAWQTQ